MTLSNHPSQAHISLSMTHVDDTGPEVELAGIWAYGRRHRRQARQCEGPSVPIHRPQTIALRT